MRRSMLVRRSCPGAARSMLSTSSIMRPWRSWITRFAPVLAGQPVVEGELEAFLALVVDVGEAEQVPGHFARRVVAAVLAQRVHAGDAERLDPARRPAGCMWRAR